MRIGLVIYGDLSTTSGGYLYDRMLVHHLRSLGNQVEIVSLPWRSYPRHLLDNLSPDLLQRHFPSNGAFDVVLQDELNHPSLFLVNHRVRQRNPLLPLVSVVHHLRSDEDHPAQTRVFYRAIERMYLRSVDGFIFNSNTTRARVLTHRNGNAAGIVAFPAADHLDPPPKQQVMEDLVARRDPSRPLRILFVGNVIPRKGLHTLLEAMAYHTIGEVRLEVAGSLESDREYSMKIQRTIAHGGLQDRVMLHGSVAQEALRSLYGQSDVLAVPSYEGFGIVYLEAMSYGLPVIATTAGAAHEIVDEGRSGFLAPPGDAAAVGNALTQLAGDRDLLWQMGVAARARYDRHPSWRETFSGVPDWLTANAARRD